MGRRNDDRRIPILATAASRYWRPPDPDTGDRRIPTLETAGSEGTKTERIPCDMNSIEKENVASDLYSDATSSSLTPDLSTPELTNSLNRRTTLSSPPSGTCSALLPHPARVPEAERPSSFRRNT